MHMGDEEPPTGDVELRHDAELPQNEELPTSDGQLRHDVEPNHVDSL